MKRPLLVFVACCTVLGCVQKQSVPELQVRIVTPKVIQAPMQHEDIGRDPVTTATVTGDFNGDGCSDTFTLKLTSGVNHAMISACGSNPSADVQIPSDSVNARAVSPIAGHFEGYDQDDIFIVWRDADPIAAGTNKIFRLRRDPTASSGYSWYEWDNPVAVSGLNNIQGKGGLKVVTERPSNQPAYFRFDDIRITWDGGGNLLVHNNPGPHFDNPR